ncbi:DUF5686 and carboxypeptidase regulatory-like domain-containing protein [Bacteroidota bacterium]
MKKKFIFAIIIMLCSIMVSSQSKSILINGYVKDISGNPLPFASVYIKGSTNGTATNPEGFYELEAPQGIYEIVFQYVGYKSQTHKITASHSNITLSVELEIDNYLLNAVIISSDAEDPAYRIIRNAIKKRKYHLQNIESYTSDVYTKGIFEMTEAPDKMFGDSLNTKEDSILGIFYLSESESRIHFKPPDKVKEEMISSKVSGNNRGFSMNFISFFMMNFYENKIQIPIDRMKRGFISPIAYNALFYYKYRLEGTFWEDDLLINKIKVIPKRKNDPVFSGYIYIIEDLWSIFNLDLTLSKEAQIDFIDSIKISKSRFPVKDSMWLTFTQKLQFYFSINVFGKKFAGNGLFHSQHTNYNFNVIFDDKFFNNEMIKVDPEANKKDSLYWEENRPIPLTNKEKNNYHKEDRIATIQQSRAYLDSLDRKRNKIKWNALWNGYDYYRRRDSTSFSIGSPLTTVQFNTVQGLFLRIDLGYSRRYSNRKSFSLNQAIGYGFSNEKFTYNFRSRYYYNPAKFASIIISGGYRPEQYNSTKPITPFLNTAYTLLDEKNYLKIYQKTFLSAYHYFELVNGLYLGTGISYANRQPMVNNTNYKWVNYDSRDYTSNNPQNPDNDSPAFKENQNLKITLSLKYRINQKYMSIPNKVILANKNPDIMVSYTKGINGVLGSDMNYDLIQFGLQGKIKMGLVGTSNYLGVYGNFFNNSRMEFMDFHHFNGNRTIIANEKFDSYQVLDYYKYSTNGQYIEAHFEHHFNGFIFNKLPLIRKTKWRAVGGIHYFNSDFNADYFEVNVGIKNIFKVIRIDFITAFNRGENVRTGVVVRISGQ